MSVYSDTGVFRYPGHLGALEAGEVFSPVHVCIKPTNDCNHHCIAENKNRMILDYLGTDSDHAAFV